MRIKLTIEYDGTNYAGWQRQENALAVQQVIEDALSKLTKTKVVIQGASRTDSGVHALGQIAHFDTESRIPPEKFAYALNVGLPADIRIKYSDEAGEGFHSRFDVLKKSYRYAVLNSPHASAFKRNTALHVHYPLNMEKMREAAKLFLGTHDFLAYKAANSTISNTVRSIYRSEWKVDGSMLYYHVTGSGFLYNMVRIMAGTMIDIGLGRIDASKIEDSFIKKDRHALGITAPAKGLTLMRVEYDGFDTRDHTSD